MKGEINLCLIFLTIILSVFLVSGSLEITTADSLAVNKTYNKDYPINITIKNTSPFTFYNISFENNEYLYMNKINRLDSGQGVNTTIYISTNDNIDNEEIKLVGYYETNVGTSDETYNIDVNYEDGLSNCDFSIYKGDTIKWNNNDIWEFKIWNYITSSYLGTIVSGNSFSFKFDTPQEFRYVVKRYGYIFTDICTISVLDTQGYVNNPEFNDNIFLTTNINYPETSIVFNAPTRDYAMSIFESQDGIITIVNSGNETAKGITLSGDWFSFSKNNFDLLKGQSKNIGYTITPSGITQTNETNKTYAKKLNINGNFIEKELSFNVFIEYVKFSTEDGSDLTLAERLVKYCEENPDDEFCAPRVVYRNNNSDSDIVSVNVTQEQLNEIMNQVLNNQQRDKTQDEYLREVLSKLGINITETANQSIVTAKKVSETEEKFSDLLSGVYFLEFIVLFMFIALILVYLIIKKRREREYNEFSAYK